MKFTSIYCIKRNGGRPEIAANIRNFSKDRSFTVSRFNQHRPSIKSRIKHPTNLLMFFSADSRIKASIKYAISPLSNPQ